MAVTFSRLFGFAMVVVATLALAGCGGIMPKSSSLRASQSLKSATLTKLKDMGSSPGQAMMIRLFKQTNEFEVWKRTTAGTYKLFKTYEICAYSGTLGPKIKEGDRQAPEGFYNITPGLMNPNSSYYLSFDTGFPNKFDRAYGRTGSDLMVHGDCSSRGCYSMTDEAIAEIYALVRESFAGGNPVVQMQIYPFRMTPQRLAAYSTNPNIGFWQNLKEGYDRFELAKMPPSWDVCEKKYVFDLKREDGSPLEAAAACPPRSNDSLWMALQAKQAADDAVYKTEVAAISSREAKNAAAVQAEAEAKAAAKARGDAMGNFVGGLFGGGQPAPAETPTETPASGGGAPVPAPAPKGT
ncbi:murein L,D-transpeptidase family protein [Devosia sp. 66-22]|uniref:L,D-transpeptidase family protein n=1 Tax=Devosia sp. 66-22 TaxID=1895753 RepID=UPI000A3F1906|nr:murein L,D-transpeptidase family protein [Devosia sp. 66-22]